MTDWWKGRHAKVTVKQSMMKKVFNYLLKYMQMVIMKKWRGKKHGMERFTLFLESFYEDKEGCRRE